MLGAQFRFTTACGGEAASPVTRAEILFSLVYLVRGIPKPSLEGIVFTFGNFSTIIKIDLLERERVEA